jgi:hypothetical protein
MTGFTLKKFQSLSSALLQQIESETCAVESHDDHSSDNDVAAKHSKLGRRTFADLRMIFRQNFFLQDWFRNKLGVRLGLGLGLELVFGIR